VNNLARWDGSSWGAAASTSLDIAYGTHLAAVGDSLYLAGRFPDWRTPSKPRLLRWDGTSWQAVAGLPDRPTQEISSITSTPDGLLIGGRFGYVAETGVHDGPTTIVNNVAELKDGQWIPLGVDHGNGLGDEVSALTWFQGELYAGGNFTTAGGRPANHVARGDGTHWHAVGSLAGNGFDAPVDVLVTTPTGLVAGGQFSFANVGANPLASRGIARWDGTEWHPLGNDPAPGFNGRVRTLLWSPPWLYAGGEFSEVSPNASSSQPRSVAKWDGFQWEVLGSGPMPGIPYGQAYALAGFKEEIYVGGMFVYASNGQDEPRLTRRIARWDHDDWLGLGDTNDNGVSVGQAAANANMGWVSSLAASPSDLYVGGVFSWAHDAPGTSVPAGAGLARWDGSRWHAMSTGARDVTNVSYFDNQVYIGGSFESENVRHGNEWIGVNGIVAWNGENFTTVGPPGEYAPSSSPRIRGIVPDHRGGIYVIGNFGRMGDTPASGFAYLDLTPDRIFRSAFDR
jgi:hypothetical protein